MTVEVVLAIVSVLCALAALTLAGMWATVELLGWWSQRQRAAQMCRPVLVGADIDPIDDTARLEQEQLEHEFSTEVEMWLSARSKYDEWLGA